MYFICLKIGQAHNDVLYKTPICTFGSAYNIFNASLEWDAVSGVLSCEGMLNAWLRRSTKSVWSQ